MAPKNQRWWLRRTVSSSKSGRADVLTRWSRLAPHRGVEPDASGSSGGRRRRARGGHDVRGPQRGGPGRRIRYSRHGECRGRPGTCVRVHNDEGGRQSTAWRYGSSPWATAPPASRGLRGAVDPDVGPHPRRAPQPPQGVAQGHAHDARAPQASAEAQSSRRPRQRRRERRTSTASAKASQGQPGTDPPVAGSRSRGAGAAAGRAVPDVLRRTTTSTSRDPASASITTRPVLDAPATWPPVTATS